MTWTEAPVGMVVTGMGAVAGVGDDVEEIFEALCAGRSGRAPLKEFDSTRFRARHAYEIDDRGSGKGMPLRATSWLLRAVEEALADAGLRDDLGSVPVLVGTGLRELRSVETAWQKGPGGEDFDLGRLHFGTALRERFGATRTYTLSNACSASLHTLAMAQDLIAAGEADTVVVAGVDTITASMFGLLDRVQMTVPDRVRPFDRERRGTLMGDGAAAIVLTRQDGSAGERAHGLLRGVAMNCDAGHPTAPDPQGISAAIRSAHERAGVKPDDIDLVVLHGTGTLLNDEAETTAVGEVFGPHASHPLMTALKGMTGHTSGGSGLLSLIVAARSLSTGRVPPTVGLDHRVPGAEPFRFVLPGQARPAASPLRLAQINAFGFGGVNAVAVLEGIA
ncbi:beta-ketoacyl-[acyl-carrier-protein] synthase family protein [Streptomyces cinerochromogenes]|uniref:beta-ketoacyl-[acyl-carrier-protein] synthase family protein n=1 Tax=Streptomyces cinerochromogenes TaxID=66422 RepID=UPI0019837336|nr:beta-ketoacyl-[acyl-carrier-protein] synthase family protein [Streptomyces cinerochromogenes]GGS57871.1 3-oxoacyl-ACP synthase II [Streptomyces cinerochromogenes]